MTTPPTSLQTTSLEALVEKLNAALKNHADKDWNYSRICLTLRRLDEIDSPYVLAVEVLDLPTREGARDLKSLLAEAQWGERHSNELGMLEIISLRINKALLDATSDEYWNHRRPVIRITSKDSFASHGIASAIWYEIHEVAGEDFENR